MALTFQEVEQALPYDLYEIIVKKKLETETRLNPMKLLVEKDASMITTFDKLKILQMIELDVINMECFIDMMKVFEKLKDYNEEAYMWFFYMFKHSICKRLQFDRGYRSQVLRHLRDDEYMSIPQLFSNLRSYVNMYMPQNRLSKRYIVISNIHVEKCGYNFLLEKETPMYTAFEKIFRNPNDLPLRYGAITPNFPRSTISVTRKVVPSTFSAPLVRLDSE
jgi:hypothetical protein